MVKDDSRTNSTIITGSPNTSVDSKRATEPTKYKTELCRTWVEHNYCPYKEKCRFAHGKKDLHDKIVMSKNYKQKECNSFYTRGYCPYGPRCHFKHDERKLWEIERDYFKILLMRSDDVRTSGVRRLEVLENLAPNNRKQMFSTIYTPKVQYLNLFQNNLNFTRLF
jgi:hypothetical protein